MACDRDSVQPLSENFALQSYTQIPGESQRAETAWLLPTSPLRVTKRVSPADDVKQGIGWRGVLSQP